MYNVVNSCLDIEKNSLFNTAYCKNVSLEEFDRVQTLQTTNVTKLFKSLLKYRVSQKNLISMFFFLSYILHINQNLFQPFGAIFEDVCQHNHYILF